MFQQENAFENIGTFRFPKFLPWESLSRDRCDFCLALFYRSFLSIRRMKNINFHLCKLMLDKLGTSQPRKKLAARLNPAKKKVSHQIPSIRQRLLYLSACWKLLEQ